MTEIENRKHVSFDEKNLIDIKTATTNVIKNRPKHTKSGKLNYIWYKHIFNISVNLK